MPDVRHDTPAPGADAEVRAFVRRAAAATTPPGPFDVAAALHGGRRRVARRRRAALAGTAAVAAAVAAVAVVAGLGQRSTLPPPAVQTPTPTATSTSQTPEDPGTRLARLLADPDAAIGDIQFAGTRHAAATLRACHGDGGCDSAVLLTGDGWRSSSVAHLVPGTGRVWVQLLPDGSVAFVPEGDADPAVLHPDGSLSTLFVSTDPAEVTDGSVLTTGPPLAAEGPPGATLWVLDPQRPSLRPLRTTPRGSIAVSPPRVAGDGTVVVAMSDPGPPPVTMTVARSTDGGRSWTYTPVAARSRLASLPGGLTVGFGGRMALSFSSDGATISPLVELWTSADAGRTWTRMRPGDKPRFTDGMGYAPDGTLLLADPETERMWRTTGRGADLERAPGLPHATSLTSTGGVLVAQTGPRTLAVSDDGSSWAEVTIPAKARD